jgi:uncharacterized protein (DUF433 family)
LATERNNYLPWRFSKSSGKIQDPKAPFSLGRLDLLFDLLWFKREVCPMATPTFTRYVTQNPEILGGEPIIAGTRTSVRAIVGLWRLGTMPEEIPNHLPHLTLAQVFDALSFYLDHQTEINAYIEQNQVPNELVHPSVKAVLDMP